jgi:hypothetical protein
VYYVFLRLGSAAAHQLGLRVRILPGAWLFVSCGCCVFSGRGLCDLLITRPEESYPVWCVCRFHREASITRDPDPLGPVAPWGWGGEVHVSAILWLSSGINTHYLEPWLQKGRAHLWSSHILGSFKLGTHCVISPQHTSFWQNCKGLTIFWHTFGGNYLF